MLLPVNNTEDGDSGDNRDDNPRKDFSERSCGYKPKDQVPKARYGKRGQNHHRRNLCRVKRGYECPLDKTAFSVCLFSRCENSPL